MNQPKRRRYHPRSIPWAGIFFFGLLVGMALFGLALGASHPLVACVVEADPAVKGRAYAQFEFVGNYTSCSDAQFGRDRFSFAVYETNNYGQTWYADDSPPPEWGVWHTPENVAGLTAADNQLWYNGRSILVMPHQLSQVFAYPNDSMGAPDGLVSSAAPPGQGVLYAAMGEYGLLVGPNPAENAGGAWQWVQGNSREISNGVDPQGNPTVLSSSADITHLAESEALLVFALTLPLVFLAQSWLLGQVWGYMYSPDETYTVMSLARWVAAAVSALYVAIVAFWKADAYASFFILVGVFGLCTVALSVIVGVSVAHRRKFTDVFVRKLGVISGLLSFIVPVVVVATPTQISWPMIVALILGFIFYRRALSRYLDQFEARTTLWQIDRLTLEIEGLFVLLLVPTALLSAAVLQDMGAALVGLSITGVPVVAAVVMWVYTKWRGRNFVLKKKASPLELHNTPLFSENRWFGMLLGRTVLWLLVSVGIWVLLALPHFVVQVSIAFQNFGVHS